MFFRMKRFWYVLLIPLSMLLTHLAHSNPNVTERWFSMGIYRVLTETYGRLFGYLPFSVFQFVIVIFVPMVAGYIVLTVYRLISGRSWPRWLYRDRSSAFDTEFLRWDSVNFRIKTASRFIANGAFLAGVIWFMLTFAMGLNYARQEFGEIIGLEIRPSTVVELAALTEILVEYANEQSGMVERNEYGHMVVSAGSYFALSREARDVFRAAGEEFPVLRGYVPRVKPVLFSQFLSQLRITGVYVPFTMEAHVNVHVPDYHIPATMIHELAHFRGIMREDEANFIAWLVGYYSGHADFMYSGTMLALAHASSQLHRASPVEWQRVMGELSEDVWVDFRASREYWQQFEGRLAELSEDLNDAHLRAHRQEDGVYSYGRVVDLLLAYFRE